MAGFSKRDEQYRQYALTAAPVRVLLSACMPLALYQALQSIFKIFDALLASHIGAEAVSAVSCLSQITLMITAIGSGLAIGGSIKISEAYGRGDDTQVRQRVATVYAMAVLVSVMLAGTLIPFAAPFLRLLKTPEDLITTGVGYFRVEILTLVVTFFNTVYIAIERSRGHAKKILKLNLVIILVKLGLSAVFVFVLPGADSVLCLADHTQRRGCFPFLRQKHPDEQRNRGTPAESGLSGFRGENALCRRKGGCELHVRCLRRPDGGCFGHLQ